MTHGTWQNSQASMVSVKIRIKTFIAKNPKYGVFLCVSCTRGLEYINEYGKFPSTGPGSRVRVQVPEYGSTINKISTLRFPSTGPGSRVRILAKITKIFKMSKKFQIFNIHLQDWCWSICHVPWVMGFESGLKRLILVGDIRLRSWPNIGDSYGIVVSIH